MLNVVLMAHAKRKGLSLIAMFIESRMQKKYGVFISHKSTFPPSLNLKHPVGIVIGEGVRLGERVRIYQNVTLGGARVGDSDNGNYPEIGDDTVIFAGAKIIGNVRVGRNCVIGANSVVTRDVPDFSTAAGIPARVINNRSEN